MKSQTYPKNWDIEPLKNSINLINGRAYALHEWESSGIPVIRLQNLTGSSENYYYSNLNLPEKNYCYSGDLLYMWSATFGPYIWSGEKAIFHYHIWKLGISSRNDKDYIYHLLNNISENLKKTASNGGTMLHITKGFMDELLLPLPPFDEQQKIAQALTDADNYISALEKLIEKKKMIKEGLLSELFKKESEWNAYAIEDLVLPNNGLVRGPFGGALKKEDFVNEGYKVYEQKNAIYKNSELGTYYINKNKYRKLIRFAVRSDDLILSCSGTIGKIYRIPSNFEKGVINQALLIIRINQTIIDLDYFEHYFNRQDFQTSIIDDTQGGAMKNLVGMPIFKKKIIYCPDMNKQKEISKILNNLDLDIDSIDKKLDKAKKLKQGMMQKLLTGEIRLA
ncbi:restriction endonuclease subunit S [Acinetobacter baumannii]|uniref:restriction endonuclease subunit S n=1 Tax=Acinetobacter baumannii TaxID=470 RepID=UPI0023407A39|nr:restriction endonuclease subunit S [Acinetobacter baumannii]MDC4734311.1 restriction endonuclease subunit S [Acinetobacter baumannii]MDI7714737.1 restriction endonuclease subunit S [Acinetobacter baumannii]MDR9562047.1 restriction endonuclease subunit S [Acinetobacter baumannii]